MQFNKEKCKVLQLGRNNPRHQQRLGTAQLESSLAENALGILVDTKLNMGQQCALAVNKPDSVPSCIKQCIASRLREASLPLCSALCAALCSAQDATPRVQCPVLDSPAQESHGHTGESSKNGHKDDEGTAASLL